MAQPAAYFVPPHIPVSSVEKQQTLDKRMTKDERETVEGSPTEGGNLASPAKTQISYRHRRSTSSHRRLLFYDPVAFRYLEEDPATIVLDRRRRLEGYELYVVEQWACSRTHPTFLIATYTGDTSKTILVDVLSVPSDSATWSPRLKLYFDAISQHHGKERDTPIGTIMVTNLSGFPSALNVLPVPDGDVRKHREDFIVNVDLKRMGCSGRAAINLQPPQSSTVAKFHQLYHTSESAGTYPAVMELVKLCQTALAACGKLEEGYVDGLLCDLTEKAIGDWWTDIGVYFYNTEPSDGILGPTTVAGLLGLFIGAYNRLKAFGAPVGKDILDSAALKRAIGSFQKGAKIERTRCLDRETLDRLHRATAKAASGEGWTVGKALKSTVSDVTGKGGEMVMGIVGGRDKASIAAAETLEIDQFAQVVIGPKMKWLWQGKQKPTDLGRDPPGMVEGRVFSTDDQGGFLWTSDKREQQPDPGLERTDTFASSHTSEGRSGLGRFRDTARGLKSHGRVPREGDMHTEHIDSHPLGGKQSSFLGSRPSTPTETQKSMERPAPPAFDLALKDASPNAKSQRLRAGTTDSMQPTRTSARPYREQLRPAVQAESPRKRQIQSAMTQLREDFKSAVYQDFSADFEYSGPQSRTLRRTASAVQVIDSGPDFPRQNRLNRQLSFSLVEGSVLRFNDAMADTVTQDRNTAGSYHGPIDQMTIRDARVVVLQRQARKILRVQQALTPFVQSKVAHVDNLDTDAQNHLEELSGLYYQKLEEYQALRATTSDVVAQEKGTLTESLRRLEMLGAKLDYELNALHSRLQEVEDGVDEFEKNVIAIEQRVKELAGDEDHVGVPWFQRLVTFLGAK